MNALHIERVSEDKLDAFLLAQTGNPVPGKDAFNLDDEIIAKRLNEVEKGLCIGGYVLVNQDVSMLIQNADVHHFGM